MLHTTNHTVDALRFLVAGPVGVLEMRVAFPASALIYHAPTCDGSGCDSDCESEVMPGEEIAVLWRAFDHHHQVIVDCLSAAYLEHEAALCAEPEPQPQRTPEQRDFIDRLRDPRNWPGNDGLI